MGISNSAVLVELNVSTWGASKLDRDVTDTVNTNNNASSDASKVYKNLAAGSTVVSDISKYAAKIRLYHNTMTMAWASKGARLLPTSLVLEYKQAMNNMKITYDNMCNKFYADYYNIVATAQAKLNGMYKAEDYPTLAQVQDKYGFKLVFSPLPDTGDWRLDIAAEELKDLAASYEADFNDRLAEAVRTPWEKLYKELTALSVKLNDEGTDPDKKKRYHDSLIDNPQELCRLLTHLNVTNDPKLEQARKELELAILGVDIEDIKESELVRHDVKTRVDAILEKFDW
jgi:hypothetical protein